MRKLTIERDLVLTMDDGARLYTDVYRPADPGPHPTLVYRVRGDKDLAFITGTLMVSPVLAADRGYAVVVQQNRGRKKSDGEWHPFVHERSDGLRTLEWTLDQPWCNGRVGTYGSAYAGVNALQLAATGHPAIEAVVAFVTGANYHDGWITTSGAFELGWDNFWAYLTAAESLARLALPPDEHARRMADLAAAMRDPMAQMERLPLGDQPALDGLSPHLATWLEHPAYDEYWASTDVIAAASDIAGRVLNITGWWDNFLGSHLQLHDALAASPHAADRRLVIGPWDHFTYVSVTPTRAGAREFGPTGASSEAVIGAMTLEWFDRWLQDAAPSDSTAPGVRYFAPGDHQWHTAPAWPPPHSAVRWHLHDDGGLAPSPPAPGEVTYRYDPADPTPTIGGRTLMPSVAPAGIQDVAALADRSDVLTFDSSPLAEPLDLAGPVRAELAVSTSAEDTDFVVTLADVAPDGSAAFVADGIVRGRYRNDRSAESWFTPGMVETLDIDLWAVAWRFDAGHRIRVMVASASFPRFNRSLNTRASLAAGTLDDAVVATNTVHLGPSAIVLPVATP